MTIGGQSIALGGFTTNQGTGSKLQTANGTVTTNDCAKFDATGALVDAGACSGSPTYVYFYGAATCVSNVCTNSTSTPATYTNTNGLTVSWTQNATNTATETLVFNGQTAQQVDVQGATGCTAAPKGFLVSGVQYTAVYNTTCTAFVLTNGAISSITADSTGIVTYTAADWANGGIHIITGSGVTETVPTISTLSTGGYIQLETGQFSVTLAAGAQTIVYWLGTTTSNITIPPGSNVLLTTDGTNIYVSGVLGPGGSSTQLQYNSSGVPGGISGATTNGTVVTFAASDLVLTGASGCITSTAGVLSSTGSSCGGVTPPCTTTATAIQYNNSGAFGCVSGVTSNGTLMTVANGDLSISGATSGNLLIECAATCGTNTTVTFPANTGNGVSTTGTLTSGDCVQFSGTAGIVADAGAACGGGTGGIVPTFIASNWYPTTSVTMAPGATTLTAATIYAYPFYLPVKLTISNLGLRLTTAGTSNVQQALYANNSSTNRPTGTALCTTTAANPVNTSIGAATTAACATSSLSPGIYWCETMQNDSTGKYASALLTSTPMGWLVGSATASNILAGTSDSLNALTLAATYGTWPNETSSSFTETAAAQAPLCIFEVSSVP